MRISDWSADVCSSDLLLLAELIERHTPDGEAPIRGAAAFQLADGLARVIDQLHYEEVRPAALVDLDLGAFASHWQASLGRLRLLVDHWPGVLAQPPERCLPRSEEPTSELQSLMRISYAVFCLKYTIVITSLPRLR